MALRFRLSVAILSAVLVSQMIRYTEAQTGAARAPRAITFDCDPDQLHGAAAQDEADIVAFLRLL